MRSILIILAVFLSGCLCSPIMAAESIMATADVQEACTLAIPFVGCIQRPTMTAPQMAPVETPPPEMRESCALAIPFVGCVEFKMEEPQVPSLTNAPPPEIQQECGFAVPFAGCIDHPALEATRLDQLQNSYEVAHRSMWLNFSSDATIIREIESHTGQVCPPGSVASVDTKRPDYIRVPMSPRAYVHCAQ